MSGKQGVAVREAPTTLGPTMCLHAAASARLDIFPDEVRSVVDLGELGGRLKVHHQRVMEVPNANLLRR